MCGTFCFRKLHPRVFACLCAGDFGTRNPFDMHMNSKHAVSLFRWRADSRFHDRHTFMYTVDASRGKSPCNEILHLTSDAQNINTVSHRVRIARPVTWRRWIAGTSLKDLNEQASKGSELRSMDNRHTITEAQLCYTERISPVEGRWACYSQH
jgi:hypothetical protein